MPINRNLAHAVADDPSKDRRDNEDQTVRGRTQTRTSSSGANVSTRRNTQPTNGSSLTVRNQGTTQRQPASNPEYLNTAEDSLPPSPVQRAMAAGANEAAAPGNNEYLNYLQEEFLSGGTKDMHLGWDYQRDENGKAIPGTETPSLRVDFGSRKWEEFRPYSHFKENLENLDRISKLPDDVKLGFGLQGYNLGSLMGGMGELRTPGGQALLNQAELYSYNGKPLSQDALDYVNRVGEWHDKFSGAPYNDEVRQAADDNYNRLLNGWLQRAYENGNTGEDSPYLMDLTEENVAKTLHNSDNPHQDYQIFNDAFTRIGADGRFDDGYVRHGSADVLSDDGLSYWQEHLPELRDEAAQQHDGMQEIVDNWLNSDLPVSYLENVLKTQGYNTDGFFRTNPNTGKRELTSHGNQVWTDNTPTRVMYTNSELMDRLKNLDATRNLMDMRLEDVNRELDYRGLNNTLSSDVAQDAEYADKIHYNPDAVISDGYVKEVYDIVNNNTDKYPDYDPRYSMMTPEEHNTYNYLVNSGRYEEAKAYAQSLEFRLNNRQARADTDYDEKTKYNPNLKIKDGELKEIYDEVNNPGTYNVSLWENLFNGGYYQQQDTKYGLLTDEERKYFNWMMSNGSTEEAKAYVKSLDLRLNQRQEQMQQIMTNENLKENPALIPVLWAGNRIVKPFNNMLSGAGAVAGLLGNEDANNPYSMFYAGSNAINQFDQSVYKLADELTPQPLKDLGISLGDVYNGVTGGVDSFVAVLESQGLAGAFGAVETAAQRALALSRVMMDSGALGNRYAQGIRNGETNYEAFCWAALDALNEDLTEKYSAERLIRPDHFQRPFARFLGNMGSEGTEEGASALLGLLEDWANGTLTREKYDIYAQILDKDGYTTGGIDAAERQLAGQKAGDVLKEAAGGALGSVAFLGGEVRQMKNNRQIGQRVLSNNALGDLQNLQNMFSGSDYMSVHQFDPGNKTNNAKTGQFYNALVQGVEDKTEQFQKNTVIPTIENTLTGQGVDNRTAKSDAKNLGEAMLGGFQDYSLRDKLSEMGRKLWDQLSENMDNVLSGRSENSMGAEYGSLFDEAKDIIGMQNTLRNAIAPSAVSQTSAQVAGDVQRAQDAVRSQINPQGKNGNKTVSYTDADGNTGSGEIIGIKQTPSAGGGQQTRTNAKTSANANQESANANINRNAQINGDVVDLSQPTTRKGQLDQDEALAREEYEQALDDMEAAEQSGDMEAWAGAAQRLQEASDRLDAVQQNQVAYGQTREAMQNEYQAQEKAYEEALKDIDRAETSNDRTALQEASQRAQNAMDAMEDLRRRLEHAAENETNNPDTVEETDTRTADNQTNNPEAVTSADQQAQNNQTNNPDQVADTNTRNQNNQVYDPDQQTNVDQKTTDNQQNLPADQVTDQTDETGTGIAAQERTYETDDSQPAERGVTLTIRKSDGTTTEINAADIDTYDDATVGTIVHMAMDGKSALSVNELNLMLQTYKGGNLSNYIRAWTDAYTSGFYGYQTSATSTATLTSGVENLVHQAGADASQKAENARMALVKSAASRSSGAHGKLTMDAKINRRSLDANQNGAIGALRIIARGTGVNFHIYKSDADENGMYTGKNGYFDPNTNTIYIDVNAGRNYTLEGYAKLNEQRKAEGKPALTVPQVAMLRTAAHELTHFIENNSAGEYAALRDYITNTYKAQGTNFNRLVEQRIDSSAQSGVRLTRAGAVSEVIADGCEMMLNDTELLNRLAKQDRNLFNRIKNFISDWAQKVQDAFLGAENPEHEEAKRLMQQDKSGIYQYSQELKDMWQTGLLAAVNNTQNRQQNQQSQQNTVVQEDAALLNPAAVQKNVDNAAALDGPVNPETDSFYKSDIGNAADAVDENGDPLFSLRSMQEDKNTYIQMLEDSGIMTGTDIEKLANTIDAVMDRVNRDRGILDFGENIGRKNRAFNPVKPNSDPLYKVSMDFSTLCRKRLLQQAIQERLETQYNTVLTAQERVAIRDALFELAKEGKKIEVACALCYVESARLKSPAQIDRWLKSKAEYMTVYYSKKNADYAAKIQQAVEAYMREKGYPEGTTLKQLSRADNKAVHKLKKQMYDAYKPTAEEQATINRALAMDDSNFKTAKGLWDLKQNEPDIFDSFTTHVRNATKSKGIEGDTPFYAGDTDSISDSLIKTMNDENGMRMQSWSDYQVYHTLDYMAAVAELATRKAKVQTYTKVPAFLKLMGRTGAMINMSMIPRDYNGRFLEYDNVEGMDYDTMMELREQYHDTAGNIVIGISDEHIRALLSATDVDYVIPYHKSSLSKGMREAIGLKNWKDYEKFQNETNRDYDNTVKDKNYRKHLKFSDWFDYEQAQRIAMEYNARPDDQKTAGTDVAAGGRYAMQQMAQRYVEECHRRGLQEKFAQFANEDGYWKLLIDRKMIDQVTGDVIEQQAVLPIFDQDDILEVLDDEVKRFEASNADMESAMDIISKMWESGEIQNAAKSKKVVDYMKASVARIAVQSAETQAPVQASVRDTQTTETEQTTQEAATEQATQETTEALPNNIQASVRDTRISEDPEKYFGTTNSVMEAGYITPNGKMLDFSGRHEGGTDRDVRNVDHRDIQEVFNGVYGTDAMVAYMADGAIRLSPESGGINLQSDPSDAQIAALSRYIRSFRGEVMVDVDDASGNTQYTFTYDSGTSPQKILSDIHEYFQNGTVPDAANYQQENYYVQASVRDNAQSTETVWDYLEGMNVDDTQDAVDARFLTRFQNVLGRYRDAQIRMELAQGELETATTQDERILAQNHLSVATDQYNRLYRELTTLERDENMRDLEGRSRKFINDYLADHSVEEVGGIIAEYERTVTNQDKQIADLKKTIEDTKRVAGAKSNMLRSLDALDNQIAMAEQQNATKTQIKQLREQFERELKAAKAKGAEEKQLQHYKELDELRQAKEKAQDTIKKLRATNAQKLLEQQNYYRDMLKRNKDIRDATLAANTSKRKIGRTIRQLDGLIRRETDYKNVPEELKPLIESVLKMFASHDADGNRIVFNREMAEILNTEYRRLLDRDDIGAMLDEDVADQIADLAKNFDLINAANTKGVSRLDRAQQLKQAYESISDIVTYFKNMVARQQEVFVEGQRQKISDLNAEITGEMNQRKNTSEYVGPGSKAVKALDKAVHWYNLTPAYFFRRLNNSGMMKLWNELHEGENQYGLQMQKAKDAISKIQQETNYFKWSKEDRVLNFDGSSGRHIKLTTEQAMAAWATWTREQLNGMRSKHLEQGGYVLPEEYNNDKKLVRQKQARNVTGTKLNDADMKRIADFLTEEQKEYVRRMVDFLSNDMSQLGNEVSMKLYGIKKFKESFYYPFKSFRNNLYQKSDAGSQQNTSNDNRAKSKGFTKSLTAFANNAVLLEDFSKTVADHISEMITYNSMVMPIENLNRILNAKTFTEDGVPITTRSLIQLKYGDNALGYMQDLMSTLNGGIRSDHMEGAAGAMLTLFKKGAVSGSLSVAAQQPLSYIRAATVINPKYLARSAPDIRGNAYEEAKKYAGTAVIKDIGGFDVGTGKSNSGWLLENEELTTGQKAREALFLEGAEAGLNRLDEITGFLPEKADAMTWGQIWKAIKMEQADLHKDMDVTSDEFLELCGRRFNDVMTLTQVYDSALSKSLNLQSKSLFMKMTQAFMNEPVLTANLLYDAFTNTKNKDRENHITIHGAIVATVCSALLQAGIKGMFTAGRKKDPEKTIWEKWAAAFSQNALDELNPLNLLPLVKDAVAILQGDSVERTDLSVISEVYDAFDKWQKGKITDPYSFLETVAGAVAKLAGVPLKNVMRDIRGTASILDGLTGIDMSFIPGVGNAKRATNWQNVQYSLLEGLPFVGNKYSDINTSYDYLYDLMKNGNTEEAANVQNYLVDTKGKKDTTVTAALRYRVLDDYMAGGDGDELARFMVEHGMSDNVKQAWQWLYKNADAKAHEDDPDYKQDLYNPLREALLSYDQKAVDEVSRELTSHGVSDYTLDNKKQSIIGDWYADGTLTREEAEDMLRKQTDLTGEDDLYWFFDKIDHTEAHDGEDDPFTFESESYSYHKWHDLFDAISAGDTAKVDAEISRLDAHGEDEDTARSKAVGYIGAQWMDGTMSSTEATKAYMHLNPEATSNDLYWFYDNYQHKKDHENDKGYKYSRYQDFYDLVLSGKDASAEFQRIVEHTNKGNNKSQAKAAQYNIGQAITSKYKSQLVKLVKNGKTAEAANLQAQILDMYVAAGYKRADRLKLVQGWYKDVNK